MAAGHTDTNSIRKVIEDHNCETCHLVFNSKKSLRKHMTKKHIAIGRFACDKCDNVESKASVVKEQARNSSIQNVLFDEPILRNRSIEETLPTSLPNVEPKVYDHIVEVQDAVELPTSIPSVEQNVQEQREEEEDRNGPKGKDEDKSNSEDDEREST